MIERREAQILRLEAAVKDYASRVRKAEGEASDLRAALREATEAREAVEAEDERKFQAYEAENNDLRAALEYERGRLGEAVQSLESREARARLPDAVQAKIDAVLMERDRERMRHKAEVNGLNRHLELTQRELDRVRAEAADLEATVVKARTAANRGTYQTGAPPASDRRIVGAMMAQSTNEPEERGGGDVLCRFLLCLSLVCRALSCLSVCLVCARCEKMCARNHPTCNGWATPVRL